MTNQKSIAEKGIGLQVQDLASMLTVEVFDQKPNPKLHLNQVQRITIPANSEFPVTFDTFPTYIYYQSTSGVDLDISYGSGFLINASFVVSHTWLIPIPCPKTSGFIVRNNNASSAELVFILSDK